MNFEKLSDKELKSLKDDIAREQQIRKQRVIDSDHGFIFEKNEYTDAYGEKNGKYGVTFKKNNVSYGFVYENKILLTDRLNCDDVIFIINKCKEILK